MNFSRNAQQGFRGVELFGTPFLSAAAYLSAVPGQQRVALEVYFFHPACYSRIAVPFVFSECLQKNRVDWNDVVHAGSLKGIYSREWGHDSSSISSALSKKKKIKRKHVSLFSLKGDERKRTAGKDIWINLSLELLTNLIKCWDRKLARWNVRNARRKFRRESKLNQAWFPFVLAF